MKIQLKKPHLLENDLEADAEANGEKKNKSNVWHYFTDIPEPNDGYGTSGVAKKSVLIVAICHERGIKAMRSFRVYSIQEYMMNVTEYVIRRWAFFEELEKL